MQWGFRRKIGVIVVDAENDWMCFILEMVDDVYRLVIVELVTRQGLG